MQSKDSTAKVNILDLYVYITAFSVLIVFMPSVCFPLKSIFDSVSRCFTLWGHFISLLLCLKVSVFTPVLMLFIFSFLTFYCIFDMRYLLHFFPSHEIDFPFLSLNFSACKVSHLTMFLFLILVDDCSFTVLV